MPPLPAPQPASPRHAPQRLHTNATPGQPSGSQGLGRGDLVSPTLSPVAPLPRGQSNQPTLAPPARSEPAAPVGPPRLRVGASRVRRTPSGGRRGGRRSLDTGRTPNRFCSLPSAPPRTYDPHAPGTGTPSLPVVLSGTATGTCRQHKTQDTCRDTTRAESEALTSCGLVRPVPLGSQIHAGPRTPRSRWPRRRAAVAIGSSGLGSF